MNLMDKIEILEQNISNMATPNLHGQKNVVNGDSLVHVRLLK